MVQGIRSAGSVPRQLEVRREVLQHRRDEETHLLGEQVRQQVHQRVAAGAGVGAEQGKLKVSAGGVVTARHATAAGAHLVEHQIDQRTQVEAEVDLNPVRQAAWTAVRTVRDLSRMARDEVGKTADWAREEKTKAETFIQGQVRFVEGEAAKRQQQVSGLAGEALGRAANPGQTLDETRAAVSQTTAEVYRRLEQAERDGSARLDQAVQSGHQTVTNLQNWGDQVVSGMARWTEEAAQWTEETARWAEAAPGNLARWGGETVGVYSRWAGNTGQALGDWAGGTVESTGNWAGNTADNTVRYVKNGLGQGERADEQPREPGNGTGPGNGGQVGAPGGGDAGRRASEMADQIGRAGQRTWTAAWRGVAHTMYQARERVTHAPEDVRTAAGQTWDWAQAYLNTYLQVARTMLKSAELPEAGKSDGSLVHLSARVEASGAVTAGPVKAEASQTATLDLRL